MKQLHSIKISVFSKPEDDQTKIKHALISMIPFDMEKEKIELKTQNVSGFSDRTIKIFEITLQKQRHTQEFMNDFLSKTSDDDKKMLAEQKESRLDDNINFFIRIDKDMLLNTGKYFVTDSGNCYHIKLSIAAFPAKKEIALKIIEEIINQ